ncbi:interferon gamma receptor 1-like precursor [Kryptolebias marmoratus]|uniref:Interferon gamma receptor 1-like n=1 Tax=Kryptolebias marmoratus TaxID=37003 RepID=A0A3Q2ZI65_KRYMA|nr:interferon gamma receptor 1-like precursor [Kryptolebias marmoratus]
MGPSHFYLVFLVFLKSELLSAQVAPPANVTLHCHNLENILKWDYEQIPPGLRFKVIIRSTYEPGSCKKVVWVDQPPLQANLSFLSDPDFMFLLQVTAVWGLNESAPSPSKGISFSYFTSEPVAQKCSVDMPSVHVEPQPDDHVLFRFEHPWLLYRDKLSQCTKRGNKKKNKEPLPIFKYTVKLIGKGQPHSFECEEEVCQKTLLADAAQEKHCLQIIGELNKLSVRPQGDYCSQPIKESHVGLVAAIVVSVVIVLALMLIAFMVYRKKTSSSPSLPTSIKPFTSPGPQHSVPQNPELDAVTPSSPTCLLTDYEGKEVEPDTPVPNGSTGYDGRMRLGVFPNSQSASEGLEEGSANGERSAYMQGNSLEDEDEEAEAGEEELRSPYERRSVLVQLAPDDRTEGYRG